MKRILFLAVVAAVCCTPVCAKPKQILLGKHPYASWIQISPNGRWVLTGGNIEDAANASKSAQASRLWDTRTGRYRTDIADYLGENEWLPDGRLAVPHRGPQDEGRNIGGSEGSEPPVVKIRRLPGGRSLELRDSYPDLDELFDFRSSPDGRRLVILSRYFIRHFDTGTGKLLKRVAWEHNRKPRLDDVAEGRANLSPNGRFVLTYGDAPEVYDGATGKLLRRYPGRTGSKWITANVFELGREAGTTDLGRKSFLEYYDLRKPKRVWVMRGDSSEVTPLGHVLYTIGNWWVWRDAASGKVLRHMKSPFKQHELYQPSAMSPDEQSVYVLDANGNIWQRELN
jgi:hypothetical protein